MDGSGLAGSNLVTPSTVIKLLRYMYVSPARENWLSLLPVAAQDGTLSYAIRRYPRGRPGASPKPGRSRT